MTTEAKRVVVRFQARVAMTGRVAGKITRKALEALTAPSKPRYERTSRGVVAYVAPPAGISRADFENALKAGGCEVSRSYSPGPNEITVTNVKAGL
jgi:hypothetical protein